MLNTVQLILDLKPNTQYEVKARMYSNAGIGPFSEPLVVKTDVGELISLFTIYFYSHLVLNVTLTFLNKSLTILFALFRLDALAESSKLTSEEQKSGFLIAVISTVIGIFLLFVLIAFACFRQRQSNPSRKYKEVK